MVDLVNTTSGITKLNNHNYQSWRSYIKSYLEGQDLWEVIEGNDNKPPEDFYTLRKWKVKAGKVMYVLKSTIEDELLQQIKDADTPKMAWDTFASLFSNTNDAQLNYGIGDTGIRPVEMDRARMLCPKLYKAAKEGDVHCLSEINGRNMTEEEAMNIQHGNFLRRTQYGNNNILHIAARAGRDNFVAEVLCRFPFLSDQVNSQGDTPLLVAARFGHLEVVKELTKSSTENGTNSSSISIAENETSPSSNSSISVEEDRVDHPWEVGNLLDSLMNSGDMATAMEEDGDMATGITSFSISIAEIETNPSSSHPQSGAEEDGVDHPLEVGNIPVGMATALENQTNSSISHYRREVGEGIVDHQLEKGTIPDSIIINMEDVINSGDMATATEEGPVHLQLDGLIPYQWRVTNLEQGTTVTTALHEALRNRHEDVARYLLGLKPEQAAFYNLAGESPLFLAAESRCELFMSDILLSEQGYSTKGPDGLNVLHAAHGCCGEIISLLIKQKPDLMRQFDNRGKAAIHHAIEAEYWSSHDRMLEADASIALFPDAYGYTPLLTASKRGRWSACEYILKICPESIEARDHNGRNALHLCQFWTYRHGLRFVKIPEIWELLNEGDDEGNTPLHVAVKENDYEKAILLMSSVSIDLGAVNKEGLTTLDLCESDWRHLNIQRIMWIHLRRLGAPRGRRPNKHMVPIGGLRDNWVIPSPDEDLKHVMNTMSVVAALIATVTFTAALAMPDGYDSSGEANLVKKPALWAFILSDALAMCCSIAVLPLIWAAMGVEQDLQIVLNNACALLLSMAILATLVAFLSGIFAIIAPKALWVAILVCIVCSMVCCLSHRRIVERSQLSTWFMPTIITRDILRFIQLKQRRNKIKRDRRYVVSLIQRGSPATTCCVSNNNTVNS